MNNLKLVCFDLDDTLIREIHSVMLPCILNDKEVEHDLIQRREEQGELHYKDADHLRVKLLKGLKEERILHEFLNIAKPLSKIKYVIQTLQDKGIKCIVITVGPKQVAKVVSRLWGFDDYYGSDYEVVNGYFTGRIIDYIDASSKVECLKDYLAKNQINPEECLAVGDGSTDIPVFDYCGNSIAINSSQTVKEHATYAVDTDTLEDILQYII